MSYNVFGFYRSHAQLQKLGEQLDLDASGPGNEDDSKINALSDDVTGGFASPLQMNSSPHRKRSRVPLEAHDASNQGSRSLCLHTGLLILNSYSLLEVDATLHL